MTASVSIVIATYNGERHLADQLRSILDQTSPPNEVVVSDDGSDDCTLDLVRAFAASAPFPVHIYRNEARLGYSENFLAGSRSM